MDTFGIPIELTIYNQKTNTVKRKTVNIKSAESTDLAKAYRKTTSSNNTACIDYGFSGLPASVLALEPKGVVDYLLNVNVATATGILQITDADVKTALSAAGTTVSDATQLTASYNNLGTVASATGVKLKALAPFAVQTIINNGGNAVKVYALSTDYIDNTAGATGVTLAAGASATFASVKDAVTNVAGKGWKQIS